MIIRDKFFESIKIKSIGYIHNDNNNKYITINENYISALKGLEDFSHAQVMWVFNKYCDEKHRKILQFTPPFKSQKLGIFSSLAPFRPNPIAISNIEIKNIDFINGVIEISKIDAYDKTPVIDIKPYIPYYNRIKKVKVANWAENWSEYMPKEGIDVDQIPE